MSKETIGAAARVANQARRWMVSGFVVSYLGSTLVLGANTGLVGRAVLPLAWVAIYATLTTIEDMLSPLASKILSRFDPGRTLVVTEAIDAVLTVLALAALFIPNISTTTILVAYLIAVSILPLILDLCEEFYAEQVAKQDPSSALAFNAALSSVSAGLALLVAKPLGSYLSASSLVLLLALNAFFSLIAVATRHRATMLFPTRAPKESDGEERLEAKPKRGEKVRFQHLRELAGLGLVSPFTSAGLALITGLYGTYLALYFSRVAPNANTNLALLLAGIGVGAIVGPQGARLLRRWLSTVSAMIILTFAQVLFLLASAVLGASHIQGIPVLVSGIGLLALLGVCGSANVTLLRTERQVRLKGTRFSFAVGWSHSFSAGGLLVGTWAGLAFGVANEPVWGLGAATVISAALAVSYFIGRRPQPDTSNEVRQ